MTVDEVLAELETMGSAQTVKIYRNHGAPENMFGVKVGDLKKIVKKIKGQQQLALDLYDTGNSDAMYLAGLVADGSQMTKTVLNRWARQASWYMISEYTVPGVATEHPDAATIATKWIAAKAESVQSCGWATYSGVVATRADEDIDLDEVSQMLATVGDSIHDSKNRVRYTMNGFVISVGTYIQPLTKLASKTAKKIGKVSVEMGSTACKVPLAEDYIRKVDDMGRVGKKRKTIKC